MLAADELHPNDLDKLRATGFLARNYFLFNRNQWMDETVEHVSKGFLGLTMNCAKCHDHKYDPISQVDYYRMRAFFEPYHVRMDVVPGEPDLARDGIPRVFDGCLDVPTYLIRTGAGKPARQVEGHCSGRAGVVGIRELRRFSRCRCRRKPGSRSAAMGAGVLHVGGAKTSRKCRGSELLPRKKNLHRRRRTRLNELSHRRRIRLAGA